MHHASELLDTNPAHLEQKQGSPVACIQTASYGPISKSIQCHAIIGYRDVNVLIVDNLVVHTKAWC